MWKHVIYNPKDDNLAQVLKDHTDPYGMNVFVLRNSVRISDNEIVLIFGPAPAIPTTLLYDKATAGIYC